ncbi:MAG: 5-formyltetrahydrofolate cyclo-ligase [Clostridia bacterium]|nr:5-formyltetrahydrofolate cyclo-ligase [Clostridia bacterium]
MNNMTKKELRAAFKAARADMNEQERAARSREICTQILQSPLYADACCILLYAATGEEIDLSAVAEDARARGKTVAYPRCLDKAGHMAFFVVDTPARLIEGSFGILEPSEDCLPWQPSADALCIVPALAVDAFGNRIGYGKGYYDRFLAEFEGVSACAVYHCGMADTLPMQDHDCSVGYIVTPKGLFAAAEIQTVGAKAEQTLIDDASYATELGELDATDEYEPAADGYDPDEEYEPEDQNADAGEDLREKRFLYKLKRIPVLGKLPFDPVLLLILGNFALLLISRLLDVLLLDRDNEYLAVVLLQILIFMIPGYLFLRYRGKSYTKRLRLRAPAFDHVLLIVGAAGTLITGCFLLSVLMGNLSAGQSFVLYDTFTSHQDGTTMGVAYLVLAYAILPAVCEEVIFRGILCAEFEGRGVACAIAVSSVLFSMLHFNLLAMPVYLFAGVILVLVLYATRSVFCAVIVHFLYNLFCLFGQSGFADFYVTQSATTLFLILMIAALLLSLAVFFGESSRLYRSYAKDGASDAYRPATKPTAAMVAKSTALAFASPAAILCIVLYLIVCILR